MKMAKTYFWVHTLMEVEYDEEGNTISQTIVKGYVTTGKEAVKKEKPKQRFMSIKENEEVLL